jgi:UDP-glucose 4-epimerase
MKKVLLIGGAGFIGTKLSEYYLNLDYDVYVADIVQNNNKINNNRYHYLNIYNKDQNNFNSVRNDYEIIYYLAASVGVKTVVSDPEYVIDNNLSLLINILDFMKKDQRFVFFSTSEVYGNNLDCKEDGIISINSSNLRWSYAVSKLMSEYLVRSKLNNCIILRLFNVVGPGQNHNTGMVLPSFIYNAVHNKPIKIFNSGNQTRAFCYVQDAIKMFTNIAHDECIVNEIVNIGNEDNLISIKDLAELVKKITNSNSNIELSDYIIKNNNYEDISIRKPNLDKYKKLTNYIPDFKSLDFIINDIIQSGDY